MNSTCTSDVPGVTQRHEVDVYAHRGLVLTRGAGARLWDDAGREYIDCAAGIGVANVGHACPQVLQAVSEQLGRLGCCPNSFYDEPRAQLLATLAEISPAGLERAFLCNSGTEAVEAALKFARLATGRTGFVAANRGFHGRTLGALSATHNRKYRTPFEPLLPGFSWVLYNDIDKLDAAISDETAGVLLEVVQGEGGVHPATAEYLSAARRLCTQRGALLIVDEIQTGFCRTGRMFASEHFGVTPDMMCLAKALGGGLPIGAVLCSERIEGLGGLHGSTFGGNPVSCAAANAAIGVMQSQQLAAQAAEKGAYLREWLSATELPAVREIRGLGLMIGIDLRQRARPLLARLQERGIIALSAGPTVLRLLPPLVISTEDLERVARTLIDVLSE